MSDSGARRLHPGTILLEVLRGAPSLLIGIPAFFAFAVEAGAVRVALITLAVILGMAVLRWVGWRSFTYRLEGDALVIESGVLHRQRRSIPLERIQDVSIEQKPLARLAGLAAVRIETGGGEGDEAVLDSVAMDEAERLRAALRRRAAAAEGAGVPDDAAPVAFAMGPPRLLLFGVFSFSLVWLAAIFGALQWLDNVVDFNWKEWFGFAERELRNRLNLVTAIEVLALALVLGVVAGVARTVARDFDFRLEDMGDRFRRARGLLTRSETVIVKRRIQLGLVHRAPLRRLFGWGAFSVQTLGGSDDAGGRHQLAPFAQAEEIAPLVAAAGLPPFERPALVPVSARRVVRAVIRTCVPLILVFGIAGCFFPPLWLGLVAVAPALGIALLERRYHRYALGPESLQIAHGVLSQRDWTVPYPAVQVVTLRQGPLQRLLGIASVAVDTAGAGDWHAPAIADLDTADAKAVARALLARS